MTLASYDAISTVDNGELLVDLADYPFVTEPAYFQQGFSDSPKMYLRKGVADKLVAIQSRLFGNRFKIWDGWRPRTVQRAIYDHYLRELEAKHPEWGTEKLRQQAGMFVTRADDPARIPPHSTGGAVDLTLVDQNAMELDMGTGFDHFGPASAPYYYEVNPPVSPEHDPQRSAREENLTARDNRRLLRTAMIDAGFRIDDDEWWHFDYGNQIWAREQEPPTTAVYGEVTDAMGHFPS